MAEATFKTTPSINDALVIAAADMHPNWEVLSDGGIRRLRGSLTPEALEKWFETTYPGEAKAALSRAFGRKNVRGE